MDSCIFCQIVRGEAEASMVYETETACAFFDINPASPYHTLVIPREHAADLSDVSEASWLGVMKAVKHVVDMYRERLGLCDVEIGCNSGVAAQQAVFHLHVHVVPRHAGDGQDTSWTVHPELCERFGDLLERLRD